MLLFGCVLISLVLVGAPAAADENVTENSSIEFDEYEWIDDDTAIVDYELSDGEAVIQIYSTESKQIAVTDAGGQMQRGEVDREIRRVSEDDVSTVAVPVTEYRGDAAVTIDTQEVLYGLPIKTSGGSIFGTDHSTGQVLFSAGIGSVIGVLVVGTLIDYFATKLMKRRPL
ncbi:hypothetical protein C482_03704 [Natrialba chahannaoensis JCM 10990]|uniref:Uncharacterized protein n=1 Tax=Natrialba chahannaoensis JCM 10990 TaxID=1227492 RepID=M0AZY4_9EURY|nr:hypothetical protein C482_03704 [Natrialba chahannaoensis JCM 10990]